MLARTPAQAAILAIISHITNDAAFMVHADTPEGLLLQAIYDNTPERRASRERAALRILRATVSEQPSEEEWEGYGFEPIMYESEWAQLHVVAAIETRNARREVHTMVCDPIDPTWDMEPMPTWGTNPPHAPAPAAPVPPALCARLERLRDTWRYLVTQSGLTPQRFVECARAHKPHARGTLDTAEAWVKAARQVAE